MSDSRLIGALGLLSLIWGSSWMAFSELDGHCPPMRAAAIRYGAAAALLLLVALVRRTPMPQGRPLKAMLALGCTLLAAPYILLSIAGRVVPAGTTAILFALAPAALVLVASAGRGAFSSRRALYVSLAGFSAVALAMSGAISLSHVVELVMVAAAVTSVAWSIAFAKRELQGANLLAASAIQLAAASLVLGALSLVREHGVPSLWTAGSIAALGLLSVVGSAFALPLLYWLLRESEPHQVSTVEWLQAFVPVVEGAILLHQALPASFYIGATGVVACTTFLLLETADQDGDLSLLAARRIDS